jgi:hypothetical protein
MESRYCYNPGDIVRVVRITDDLGQFAVVGDHGVVKLHPSPDRMVHVDYSANPGRSEQKGGGTEYSVLTDPVALELVSHGAHPGSEALLRMSEADLTAAAQRGVILVAYAHPTRATWVRASDGAEFEGQLLFPNGAYFQPYSGAEFYSSVGRVEREHPRDAYTDYRYFARSDHDVTWPGVPVTQSPTPHEEPMPPEPTTKTRPTVTGRECHCGAAEKAKHDRYCPAAKCGSSHCRKRTEFFCCGKPQCRQCFMEKHLGSGHSLTISVAS